VGDSQLIADLKICRINRRRQELVAQIESVHPNTSGHGRSRMDLRG
jgi:hypothetical protein